jgi:3-hydroxyacyl-CoA dehydrogenase
MAAIAVVGSGFIGRAWAISFARAGLEVALFDREQAALERAHAYIADILPLLAEHDLLNGEPPAAVLGRIRLEPQLGQALEGAGHVQENTPEDIEIKRAIFSEMERWAAPDAVLASSTSSLLPSSFSEHLATRERCLVVHPINPPYLVPAAEIVPAPWTAKTVVTETAALMERVGQKPIVMKRELDGFVMNRMQGALLEEAFRLVADGYASPEDIDVGLRDGLALRWSFMGPFETIDLNAPGGVRDYVARYQEIYEKITPTQMRRVDWAGPVLQSVEQHRRAALATSDLAERQKWRDKRLMALIAHKRQAAKTIGE